MKWPTSIRWLARHAFLYLIFKKYLLIIFVILFFFSKFANKCSKYLFFQLLILFVYEKIYFNFVDGLIGIAHDGTVCLKG
jgi:hypothetical protein